MNISNQTFKPEIQQITNLVIKTKYFSRSANKKFTFLRIDTDKKQVKIGLEGGILKTLDFYDFNKQYMRDGVVED